MIEIRAPLDAGSRLPWEVDFRVETCATPLPSVSIVIPIYNSGKFLEKTIRSLLCNDLTGVELILMDGGSTDNTLEIVEHYQDTFSVAHSAPDKGQSDAINNGYLHATGEILYWLNGDDIILPNTLNKVREYFLKNSDCSVLVGNAYMTELDFSPINHFVFTEDKLGYEYLLDYAKNHLVQPSVFFTREAWALAGPLDVNDHYAMDADLFIGMSRNHKIHHIDLDIAYSVYHEDCKTRSARAESITALALVQAKHGGLKEAAATLNILVEMYKELEAGLENNDSSTREKALEARLAWLEAHHNEQKNLLIQLDMEQH